MRTTPILASIITFCFSTSFYAQACLSGCVQPAPDIIRGNITLNSLLESKIILNPFSGQKTSQKINPKKIRGSAYTNSSFLPSTVYYKNQKMGKAFYRYNAYNEEVEIKLNQDINEEINALIKNESISILVNGKSMSYAQFVDKRGKIQSGYLLLLKDGKNKLYKGTKVIFKEGRKATNPNTVDVPSSFTHFTKYYVKLAGTQTIQEIQPKTSKLIKMLSTESRDITKQYLNKNQLNMRKEQDLAQLVSFLNAKKPAIDPVFVSLQKHGKK